MFSNTQPQLHQLARVSVYLHGVSVDIHLTSRMIQHAPSSQFFALATDHDLEHVLLVAQDFGLLVSPNQNMHTYMSHSCHLTW